ncbi:hypothetical protein QJU96_04530 [Pasteurella skyensis]|uniref:Uncharacterized protein n=1 Tax=Phocoenobacter skyensis TaxID=97481 RepID=A0AAJ6P2E1_9PAST|nr:hypothetical protein [Pasteurella skyensis]MDP8170554.1 hypothetical protein [Pasteurella skyensis]MDP8174619.1 hypothetical protein [Pasteurella skyensis]
MTGQTTDKPQFKLPPRKWYTLEQACKRIYQLTGEEITIDDLIHYWVTEQLEISFYCHLAPLYFQISDTNIDIEKLVLISCFNYEKLDDYIENNTFSCSYLDTLIKRRDEQLILFNNKHQKQNFSNVCYCENCKNQQGKIKEFFTDEFINFKGFLSLFLYEYNFDREQEILKQGIFLNNSLQVISPADDKGLRLIFNIQLDLPDDSRLELKDLYILNSHLELFIQGQAKIKEIKEKLTGRKPLPIKDDVIRIAKETTKIYPNASREKLGEGIYEHIHSNNFYSLKYPELVKPKQDDIINPRTIKNYLKEENIGAKKNKDTYKKIKITDSLQQVKA